MKEWGGERRFSQVYINLLGMVTVLRELLGMHIDFYQPFNLFSGFFSAKKVLNESFAYVLVFTYYIIVSWQRL